jgi:ABC-type branched-subunit amino acid transport system ATPase component
MSEPMLELRRVSRHFGGIKAVRDVSLMLQSRQVTSLIGPNGAGKTTLFNLIAGQLRPSSGEIIFDGECLNGRGPDAIARRGIFRSFQNTMVLPGLTVQEHLSQAAVLAVIGRPIDLLRRGRVNRAKFEAVERVDAVLELTGLTAQRDVVAEALPYGLQKILGIGMAMAAQPRLLLADEPAAGLNGAETERMEQLLRAIHARGVTIVLVEHDLRLVMRLSQRVVVLAQGEVIADGRPDDVRNEPRFVEVYLGAPDIAS